MPGSPRNGRRAQAAEVVRARIADGTLKPGAPAPSGAALARVTGFNVVTCRKALDLMIMDGTLRADPSPNARARGSGKPPTRR
jgi:DNA-binding GntR family transcriptional regulator